MNAINWKNAINAEWLFTGLPGTGGTAAMIEENTALAAMITVAHVGTQPGEFSILDVGDGAMFHATLTAETSHSFAYPLSMDTVSAMAGSKALQLFSSDAILSDLDLTAGAVKSAGQVQNYATAALKKTSGAGGFSGSGTAYTLDFGTYAVGQPALLTNISAFNAAVSQAGMLTGSFEITGPAVFNNAGFAAFGPLGAGQADNLPSILFTTTLGGAFTETITMHSASSVDGGYSTGLPDTILTVTGTVVYYPTTSIDHITAGANDDRFILLRQVLNPLDTFDGGGGINTLQIAIAARYDLGLPAVLNNFQVVMAQEGQPLYKAPSGKVYRNQQDTVILRNGANLTVNVLPGGIVAGNPLGPSILIIGADSNDIINLGPNGGTVFLGSSGEAVHSFGGNSFLHITGATAGATIDGAGINTVVVDGGGTVTMGAAITGAAAVVLSDPPTGVQPDYVFAANALANLKITGSSANDTITLGAPSQSVAAGGGDDHIFATAATAVALVDGEAGANTLEITTGGTVVLNAHSDNVTVRLDLPAKLTLSKMAFISVIGSTGSDTITAKASGQVLSGGLGLDRLVGFGGFSNIFRDIAAGLNHDTIKRFGGNDIINLTNVAFGSATSGYSGTEDKGTLSVSDGAHSVSITMIGDFTQAGPTFHLANDGHGGTNITYS